MGILQDGTNRFKEGAERGAAASTLGGPFSPSLGWERVSMKDAKLCLAAQGCFSQGVVLS